MSIAGRSCAVGVVVGSLLAAGSAAAQPGASPFAGQRIGWTGSGKEVRITREVGTVAGYDDRLQATAVARMAKAEPAGVVKGRDGKWHAVETTESFFGGVAPADNAMLREVVALPSMRAIASTKQKIDALRDRVARGDRTATEDLSREKAVYASLVLGLDEREIKAIRTSADKDARYVNLNATLSTRGLHGSMPSKGAALGVDLDGRSAIELRADLVDRPALAVGTLFHEATHRADYELTRTWTRRYTEATKKKVAPGPNRDRALLAWLLARSEASLSRADAQLVVDLAAGLSLSIENRAHLRGFIAALQAGAFDTACAQLEGMFDRQYSGHPGAFVAPAMLAELETAYRALPHEAKQQFDAGLAELSRRNPTSWLAKYDHAKALAK